MRNILLPMMKWNIPLNQVTYKDYWDWSAAEQQLKRFRDNGCPYKSLVVDSITSLGDSIMDQTKRLKQGQTRRSGASAGRHIGGISVNELEDFNAESSAIADMLSILKDIHEQQRINVILIAHVIQTEMKSENGETNFSRTIVTAAKKVAKKIPAYCEETYHFNIDRGFDTKSEGSYAILTQNTGDDFANTGLPLDRKIVFNDNPLYEMYIVPAMQKLRAMKETASNLPQPEPTQQLIQTSANW